MSYLDIALANAQRGHFVFPVQENKTPPRGFMKWEEQASVDLNKIEQWWREYPEALPAVAPGRSGTAVIDVDRHEGQKDGFLSLQEENIEISDSVFSGVSMSGNGTHFWFRADVGSLNGVLESVDRKSRGGYVVAPYVLPYVSTILEPLPEKLSHGRRGTNANRVFMDPAELNFWLRTAGQGPMTPQMDAVVKTFLAGKGNKLMSASISKVVRLASGHPVVVKVDGEAEEHKVFQHSGAAKALEIMKEHWMSLSHSTGDPDAEFQVNVKSSIEKFGQVYEDKGILVDVISILEPEETFSFDQASLFGSLVTYCDRIKPDWRELPEDATVHRVLTKLSILAGRIETEEDLKTWLSVGKRSLAEALVDKG